MKLKLKPNTGNGGGVGKPKAAKCVGKGRKTNTEDNPSRMPMSMRGGVSLGSKST